jgi:hypothetical protein
MTGGRSYAEYWVGNAFRTLKEHGYTDSTRKGWWSITQKGLDWVNTQGLLNQTFTLRVLSQSNIPNTEPSVVESPAQPSEARVTETVTPAITPATMPFTMPVDETEMHATIQAKPVLASSYYEDSYLRGLAVVNTPCYGNFTNRSDECNKCLLSQSCREFFYQNLPMVAEHIIDANLKAEDAARKAAEVAAQAAANPAPVTPAASNVAAPSQGDGFIAKTTPVRVFCGVCRNAVEKDTLAYFRRGNGFVHDECRSKAK